MYRTTGIGTSLFITAVGAILLWAVDKQVDGVDLDAIGVILLVVGGVGLIASFVLGSMTPRDGTATYVDRGTDVVVEQQPRERYVEHDRF
jgi:hypothetical protein